eukprot:58860-Alexandrium_andersonii.AAC.1
MAALAAAAESSWKILLPSRRVATFYGRRLARALAVVPGLRGLAARGDRDAGRRPARGVLGG